MPHSLLQEEEGTVNNDLNLPSQLHEEVIIIVLS
jgi:hypothetical protein